MSEVHEGLNILGPDVDLDLGMGSSGFCNLQGSWTSLPATWQLLSQCLFDQKGPATNAPFWKQSGHDWVEDCPCCCSPQTDINPHKASPKAYSLNLGYICTATLMQFVVCTCNEPQDLKF